MEKRKKLEQQLIEKAMKDPNFRKRLVENPKAVIEVEMGVELPPSINLTILEEDPRTVYLILPFVPAQPDTTELAETELESIAGGGAFTGFTFCWTCHCPPYSEDC
jgi:hypothetical protein